jgi:hypothetical protein
MKTDFGMYDKSKNQVIEALSFKLKFERLMDSCSCKTRKFQVEILHTICFEAE